jgi:hypothetical protein
MLYMITFDGQPDYIEAENYAEAVKSWHEHMQRVEEGDWDSTEQPEQVVLVHDGPVIRGSVPASENLPDSATHDAPEKVADPNCRGEGFTKTLENALNCHSAETASDTPDFILAEFLVGCLDAFDRAVVARNRWYRFGGPNEQDP